MKWSRNATISLFLSAVLLLGLAACRPQANTDASSPVESAPSSQATSSPALTAEDAAALFPPHPNSFPKFVVEEVVPYGGDFLVVRRAEHGSGEAILHWVFSTGQEVNLWNGYDPSYTILGPGVVQVESNGESPLTDWQGMPERFTAVALEGAYAPHKLEEEIWLSVEAPWMVGYPAAETAEETGAIGRYEQLYNARVGITDLQFSFIPSGDPERFETFFPAATSIPTVTASFDPDSRQFTLRLHNTCLSSGGVTDEQISQWLMGEDAYLGLYPCAFPEGPLGRDTPWFSNAQVTQEGEDTLVTLTLAPDVLSYRMETGNLGYDTIPWLRVAFSNQESNWNGV